MTSLNADACSYCRVEDEEPPSTEPPSTTCQVAAPRRLGRLARTNGSRALLDQEVFSPPVAPPRIPRSTPQTRSFRRTFFPGVTDKEWNSWRWQARNRIRTLPQLERILRLSDEERAALAEDGAMLPMSITPYYMSLV